MTTPPSVDQWTVEIVERAKITHDLTGKSAEGATYDEAFGKLIRELILNGDVVITAPQQPVVISMKTSAPELTEEQLKAFKADLARAMGGGVQRAAERQSRDKGDGYTTADAIDAYEDHGVITPDEADKLREDEAAKLDALTIRLPYGMGTTYPVQGRKIGSDWNEVFPGLQARWTGVGGDSGGMVVEFRLTPQEPSQTCPGGC